MSTLTVDIRAINIADSKKPKYGDTCNNCGWCCLTGVCAVGVELSGTESLPCKFLVSSDDKHFCRLADVDQLASVLSIGSGCDAKTQNEIIEDLIL